MEVMDWVRNISVIFIGFCQIVRLSATDNENSELLEGRHEACDVLIAIDEPLWNYHDRNMTLLTNLAKAHIQVS